MKNPVFFCNLNRFLSVCYTNRSIELKSLCAQGKGYRLQMRMSEEEFLIVYEKFKRTVFAVVYNYVKNSEDANDLTQEVFLKLLNFGGEFKSEEHQKAWLIRVASNLCKNHLRSRKRFADEPISEEIPYFEKDSVEKGELMRIVLNLPEKYRIPIHLFYYEEYSVAQIGIVLGLPEATVKSRLKRGRDKLQKMLRKEDWM